MRTKEFIVQAAFATSAFDGIEIMLSDDGDAIYHRHAYYGREQPTYSKTATSAIKYAKPEWSDEEEPYFMRHGRREYLSNYMRI